MRTIYVEVMDIWDEVYLVDDIEYGTVIKTKIAGVKVYVEQPWAVPSVSYQPQDRGYYQPGRVFRTAQEAFDAIDAYQTQEMQTS